MDNCTFFSLIFISNKLTAISNALKVGNELINFKMLKELKLYYQYGFIVNIEDYFLYIIYKRDLQDKKYENKRQMINKSISYSNE